MYGRFANLFKKMRNVSLKNPERFRELVEEYLSQGFRAHLFTINGLTWPIHRDLCFLAVPDPHEVKWNNGNPEISTARSKRRYSMLAYLYNVRPGDLVFFFQADPQRRGHTVVDRRGFRGIYLIESRPFKDTTDISYAGYEILGKCPNCGFPFDFGEGNLVVRGNARPKLCPKCGRPYGVVNINGERYSRVVLPLRILTRPLIVFEKTAGDTRVYGDTEIYPLLWISRSDNAMGPGKGSSIRTLLPEEAGKIAYMLATEHGQRILNITCQGYPGSISNPITDHNGVDVRCPLLEKNNSTTRPPQKLRHELHLNLYLARVIDDPNHPLVQILGIRPSNLIYWTTEFPWGYTGDTSDFVAIELERTDSGNELKIYLFEFKKDSIDRHALAEVLLYAPWVARVVFHAMAKRNIKKIKVIPILIGFRVQLRAVPRYTNTIQLCTLCGQCVDLEVDVPILLKYKPTGVFQQNGLYYARDLQFNRVMRPIRGIPPLPTSFTATKVERDYIVNTYLQGF